MNFLTTRTTHNAKAENSVEFSAFVAPSRIDVAVGNIFPLQGDTDVAGGGWI
ncbi:MAG: hypothetical protein MJY55_06605 [Bacteroidales bacterium]|nr:hypothetical protein [Bacteroidales bacterium]